MNKIKFQIFHTFSILFEVMIKLAEKNLGEALMKMQNARMKIVSFIYEIILEKQIFQRFWEMYVSTCQITRAFIFQFSPSNIVRNSTKFMLNLSGRAAIMLFLFLITFVSCNILPQELVSYQCMKDFFFCLGS